MVMARCCIYCNNTPVTKEHVVNEAVYHEFFGKPMSFIVKHSQLGEKQNRVDKIADVCGVCNNVRLQPYDHAAKILARATKNVIRGYESDLPFSADVVGWLLKTHCNILRRHGTPQNAANISSRIYEYLRRHETVPRELYRLVLTMFIADSKLFPTKQGDLPLIWKIETREFTGPRIMRSYFRMGHFESFFYLPSDNDYCGFDERATSVVREIYPFLTPISFFDTLPALRRGRIQILG
jgi:ubiquitin